LSWRVRTEMKEGQIWIEFQFQYWYSSCSCRFVGGDIPGIGWKVAVKADPRRDLSHYRHTVALYRPLAAATPMETNLMPRLLLSRFVIESLVVRGGT